jgi:hypothetical protein
VTRLGFAVSFVRKVFGPRHIQNRIYVNKRRCQLLAAPEIDFANRAVQPLADFYAGASPWAEFLIYVPASEDEPFLIVPAAAFQESASATTKHFTEYQDRWDLLKPRSEDAARSTSEVDQREAEARATIPVVCVRRAGQIEIDRCPGKPFRWQS